jgi:plastocyanin
VGSLIAAAATGLVIWSGAIDVAATERGGWIDRVLDYASRRSILHHAKAQKNPLAKDPRALKRGLQHYRGMCLECHGAPGQSPEEFASGLNPTPPDLASPETQAFSDGMLYRTIASGIRSTGMPGFASTHSPEEIWSIVAFVRHLPALTKEESRLLGQERAAEPEPEKPAQAPSKAGAENERTHEVAITGFKFVPAALTVHEGDTVQFTNRDFVAHTATAKNGAFDTARLEANQSKRVVLNRKGTFPYYCRYHSRMSGTLTVE